MFVAGVMGDFKMKNHEIFKISSASGMTLTIVALTALIFQASTFAAEGERRVNKTTYHNNAQRTGWNSDEAHLTPELISSDDFGLLWQSPKLDDFNGTPPRLFASPVYVDAVDVATVGTKLSLAFAVSTTGYAYAISTGSNDVVQAGQIVWRNRLTRSPCGNGTGGNLSTPVIDLSKQSIYITICSQAGDQVQWNVHALELGSGKESSGWPVDISAAAVNRPGLNQNGDNKLRSDRPNVQRGALNLSPDGARLYIAFGEPTGWLLSVDTKTPKLASVFSSTASSDEEQGGMWASGGPAVDPQGRVYMATGANFAYTVADRGVAGVAPNSPHNWGQSILQWSDSAQTGLKLEGSYSPYNYCQTAAKDIDIGSSGVVVIDLPQDTTQTPHLLALGGGKQGNAYLLDRNNMPGGTKIRHPCSDDPQTDLSLLAPERQPHLNVRGPVNVFGPFSDEIGMINQAKSRSTAAVYRNDRGQAYLFVSGSTKTGADFSASAPPGLAQLKIVTSPGEPAFLRLDRVESTVTFQNPGSPVVSSNGGRNAVVWVLDTNALRTANQFSKNAPRAVLYAFDAENLNLLWSSGDELFPSGKYNEPAIVNGLVLVGTDRVQAFGSRTRDAVTSGLVPLFKANSLDGWRGDPKLWSIKDGVVTGQSLEPLPGNSFLISDQAYDDFELRFKYRFLSADGNSGFQYRSKVIDELNYRMAGYQANITPPTEKERTVMLYDEGGTRDVLAPSGEQVEIVRKRDGGFLRHNVRTINPLADLLRTIKPYPEWNDYTVIAAGNHLVHAINGYLAVDAIDRDLTRSASKGQLGLQLHGGAPMGIQFKDVMIKKIGTMPKLENRFFSIAGVAATSSSLLPETPAGAVNNFVPKGQLIYQDRCDACHGSSQSGAPSRAHLSAMARERIVAALTDGAMKSVAGGLTQTDIESLATYLGSR
jgi:mono/diheme cytochrome c family protein